MKKKIGISLLIVLMVGMMCMGFASALSEVETKYLLADMPDSKKLQIQNFLGVTTDVYVIGGYTTDINGYYFEFFGYRPIRNVGYESKWQSELGEKKYCWVGYQGGNWSVNEITVPPNTNNYGSVGWHAMLYKVSNFDVLYPNSTFWMAKNHTFFFPLISKALVLPLSQQMENQAMTLLPYGVGILSLMVLVGFSVRYLRRSAMG